MLLCKTTHPNKRTTQALQSAQTNRLTQLGNFADINHMEICRCQTTFNSSGKEKQSDIVKTSQKENNSRFILNSTETNFPSFHTITLLH